MKILDIMQNILDSETIKQLDELQATLSMQEYDKEIENLNKKKYSEWYASNGFYGNKPDYHTCEQQIHTCDELHPF